MVLVRFLLVVVVADWRLLHLMTVTFLADQGSVVVDRGLFSTLNDYRRVLMLGLLVACELYTETECWLEVQRVQKLRQEIVEFDVEFLVFVHSVGEVHVRDSAEEVDELREGKLGHPLSVSHCINDCHDRFRKNDSDHSLRHV